MEENKLYDKIFDVATANMIEHNCHFNFNHNVFNSLLYKNSRIVNVEEFYDMQPKDFIDAVYLRCLNRLPDQGAYKAWLNHLNRTKAGKLFEEYKMLMGINASAEFKIIGKKMEGLMQYRKNIVKNLDLRGLLWLKIAEPYARICARIRYILNRFIIIPIKGFIILPIWKRLPNGLKNKVRQMLGRETK